MSDSVSDLLRRSRAAHAAYLQNSPRFDPRTKLTSAGDVEARRASLQEAASLRTQAHILDPNHTDPAWQADTAPHVDILNFFVQQLAR